MSRFTKSKIYILTSLLTDEEFEHLGLWLSSPVFKPSKKVVEIYQVLLKYRKSGNLPKLTKNQLYQAVYPNKNYKASYFNYLIRTYITHVEDYLIWSSQYLKENRQLAYFSELKKRGEHHLFFKETEHFLENESSKDSPLPSIFIFQFFELLYYHSGYDSKYETNTKSTETLNQYLENFFWRKK